MAQGNGQQTFTFTTKQIPQVQGTDGAHWEKVPLASFPPTFDISIPDSTANAVAAAMSNIAASFNGLNNTLQNVTQQVQNAACSIDDLIGSLKAAQAYATQFAGNNNQTNIFVRQIGIDPVGTINSQALFMSQVNAILNDTGFDIGRIPLVVPAEIAIDPVTIANALRSGGTLLEKANNTLLGGKSSLTASTPTLAKLGVSASVGVGLGVLSNDINFQPISKGGGFSTSTIAYSAISIIKTDATTAQVTFQTSNTVAQNFTIRGSAQAQNNGSFKVQSNGVKQVTRLGNTLTSVSYQNPSALTETSSSATVVFQGTSATSAADTIRTALEQDGYYGQKVAKKTLPVTVLLQVLVKHNIIGINPDVADKDKSIALERLIKLTAGNSQRIGGIVLVGKAPNIGSLARKVQALGHIMEWMKPLGDKLAFSALSNPVSSPSGVDFDPTNVELSLLNTKKNVAQLDIESAKKKAKDSGVADYQVPTLKMNPANPPDTNFQAWRHYKPVQLIPSLLDAMGLPTDFIGEEFDKALAPVQSAIGGAIAGATGALADLIQDGKDGLETGLAHLTAQGNAIDSLVKVINDQNSKMVAGLNFLKNQVGIGPISVEGHIIGGKLTLQSNSSYVDAVQVALNDFTDPNRPTFGPAPSTSVLENQNTLKAALQGVAPPTTSTTLWFGLVLVVIGKDRQDLGEQLRVLADLLSMDSSVVDLPAKTKITIPGFK
jgi:hypothetical protein